MWTLRCIPERQLLFGFQLLLAIENRPRTFHKRVQPISLLESPYHPNPRERVGAKFLAGALVFVDDGKDIFADPLCFRPVFSRLLKFMNTMLLFLTFPCWTKNSPSEASL